MSDIEAAVRRHVSRLVKPAQLSTEEIDLDRSLIREYAISSMKMVLLMTALCKETDVSLSSFTDRDLTAIQTSRDLVAAISTIRAGCAK